MGLDKPLRITFDAAKRKRTLAERGLDFADARKVFEGREITFEDDRQDYGETRNVTVGHLDGVFVVIVWTLRKSARRVISMRRGNAKEESRFDFSLD